MDGMDEGKGLRETIRRLLCGKEDEVFKSEIAYGYKLKGHDYLVFDKKEIASTKPVSTKLIELEKFVNFFQVDRTTSRGLPPGTDNTAKPYALLRKVLEQTGLTAIGKMTMTTKERFVDPR